MEGSPSSVAEHAARISTQGWSLLPEVFTGDLLERLLAVAASLNDRQNESVRHRDGAVYAARNVLDLAPEVSQLWRTLELEELLLCVLGRDVGLVRALYFDKPPEQTWALPWHKDLLIAMAEDRVGEGYSRPRLRAGVLHSEPPVEVLESMLTLRIHLDPMTEDNGPLLVLSGSHATGKRLQIHGFDETVVLSDAGAVLAMRPLLVHASGRSRPDCVTHRRVLHLEFSGQAALPEGICWQTFLPI